jgi:hypothetical protein
LDSNAIVGNIPDFLQQIDISSLDLGDLIGAAIGSIALIVSAFTFYISHTQASQSEQIKTSREIWGAILDTYRNYELSEVRIKSEEEMIRESYSGAELEKRLENDREYHSRNRLEASKPVLSQIEYFSYFVINGEIKDKMVLGYYKPQLRSLIEGLLTDFQSEQEKRFLFDSFPFTVRLLKKWNIIN